MYLVLMTINNTIVYKMIKLSSAEQKQMKMLNLMMTALFD